VGKEMETDFSKVDIVDLLFHIADLCKQLHQQMIQDNKFPVDTCLKNICATFPTVVKV
jgi:hypothetical protein